MSDEQRRDKQNDSIDIAEIQDLERFAIRLAREAGANLLNHFLKPLEVEYYVSAVCSGQGTFRLS